MKKKIKNLLPFFIVVGVLFWSTAVFAQYGLGEAAKQSGLASNALSKVGDIPSIIGYLVSIALSLVGVFFFLLILYAGFVWMTAAGSTEKVESAKKKMTAAVIGLIIVLSAYTLTNFIFKNFIQDVSTGCEDRCTPSQLCISDNCVDKCDYIYKDYGGKCVDINTDRCDGTLFSGLCKGPINIKCCVPKDGYAQFERFLESGSKKSNEIKVTIPEKNACEKARDICVSKNTCLATYNGRDMGQNGCAQGDTCCRSCISIGGTCVKEEAGCVPGGPEALHVGYCYGAFEGYFCCTGDVL